MSNVAQAAIFILKMKLLRTDKIYNQEEGDGAFDFH